MGSLVAAAPVSAGASLEINCVANGWLVRVRSPNPNYDPHHTPYTPEIGDMYTVREYIAATAAEVAELVDKATK